MNSELIFVVEEAPEGGYLAKAVGESIYTQAETIEDLKINVKEAVYAHYDDNEKPSFVRLHFVKDALIKL
jgi:predicted RNase H-like HicB family nuclease